MASRDDTRPTNKAALTACARRAALSLVILEVIFSLHHLYGEYFVYKDGARLISILISLPVFAMTLAVLHVYVKTRNRPALWIFTTLAIAAWLGFVGLFEGGGYHIVLNIMSWTSIAESTIRRFFLRLPSGDAINEITGVLELVAALPLALYSYRLHRPWSATLPCQPSRQASS